MGGSLVVVGETRSSRDTKGPSLAYWAREQPSSFLRPILGEDQVGASGVWADIIVQHTYKRPTARSHTGPQHVRTYQEDREGMFNQANVAEGKC